LLHDIGKLVFASVEDSRYAGILRQTGAFGPGLADAEQAAFGVSHASIGARLLGRWGLPENVAVAVLDHHGSPRAAESFERMAATIHLANNLAHHMFDQVPLAPDLLSCSADAMTLLELTADDVPILIAQSQTGLQRVAGLLKMTV
jgi:HD-like signal output (HDOD) protein